MEQKRRVRIWNGNAELEYRTGTQSLNIEQECRVRIWNGNAE